MYIDFFNQWDAKRVRIDEALVRHCVPNRGGQILKKTILLKFFFNVIESFRYADIKNIFFFKITLMYFKVKIILKSNRYYTPRHPRRSISNHFSWYLHAYQALLYQIAMEMNFEVSTYALRALCTQINVLCMYYKLIFY
jgi:hypothetical protein